MDRNDLEYQAKEGLKEQFLRILDNGQIKTVFQPIVSLRDGSVYGYEALSRGPQNTDLESPQMLFEYAERYNMVLDLELLCREKAFETLSGFNYKSKMFLNVNPNFMDDIKVKQGFTKEYLSQYLITPEDIILEITEREAIKNNPGFINVVQNYKNQNYQIAIDDAGAGYSGLNLISDIHPHYIKLDMNLVRNVDKDFIKQSLIKCLAEFASQTNTSLIAEGIETENELLKLIDIGVQYGQGFYLQKPNPSIYPIDSDIEKKIKNANQKKNYLGDKALSNVYVNNICNMLPAVSPNILIFQIYEMIKKNAFLSGLCITEDDLVLGVITKNELYKRLYGHYAIYYKKPSKILCTKSFCMLTIRIVLRSSLKKQCKGIAAISMILLRL